MHAYYRWAQAEDLVERLNALREPYRRNAIAWLEDSTHHRFANVSEDLFDFLNSLSPALRDGFMCHTRTLLDDAVRFFGEERGPQMFRSPSLDGVPAVENP